MSPQAPTVAPEGQVFNPPPGWTVPAGFDPRRGHLADPAWPAPPADWQFWVARPTPRGLGAALKRGWWGPAVVAVVVLLLVVAISTAGPSSPTNGVGSCWAQAGTNGRFASVDCSSDKARYRVSQVVSDPSKCPQSSPGYFDDSVGVECLESTS